MGQQYFFRVQGKVVFLLTALLHGKGKHRPEYIFMNIKLKGVLA